MSVRCDGILTIFDDIVQQLYDTDGSLVSQYIEHSQKKVK